MRDEQIYQVVAAMEEARLGLTGLGVTPHVVGSLALYLQLHEDGLSDPVTNDVDLHVPHGVKVSRVLSVMPRGWDRHPSKPWKLIYTTHDRKVEVDLITTDQELKLPAADSPYPEASMRFVSWDPVEIATAELSLLEHVAGFRVGRPINAASPAAILLGKAMKLSTKRRESLGTHELRKTAVDIARLIFQWGTEDLVTRVAHLTRQAISTRDTPLLIRLQAAKAELQRLMLSPSQSGALNLLPQLSTPEHTGIDDWIRECIRAIQIALIEAPALAAQGSLTPQGVIQLKAAK